MGLRLARELPTNSTSAASAVPAASMEKRAGSVHCSSGRVLTRVIWFSSAGYESEGDVDEVVLLVFLVRHLVRMADVPEDVDVFRVGRVTAQPAEHDDHVVFLGFALLPLFQEVDPYLVSAILQGVRQGFGVVEVPPLLPFVAGRRNLDREAERHLDRLPRFPRRIVLGLDDAPIGVGLGRRDPVPVRRMVEVMASEEGRIRRPAVAGVTQDQVPVDYPPQRFIETAESPEQRRSMAIGVEVDVVRPQALRPGIGLAAEGGDLPGCILHRESAVCRFHAGTPRVGQQRAQMVRHPVVVGVEVEHRLSGRPRQSGAARGADAGPVLPVEADAWIVQKRPDACLRAVGAAVVDDQQLSVAVILRDHGFDRPADDLLAVEHRHEDRRLNRADRCGALFRPCRWRAGTGLPAPCRMPGRPELSCPVPVVAPASGGGCAAPARIGSGTRPGIRPSRIPCCT